MYVYVPLSKVSVPVAKIRCSS